MGKPIVCLAIWHWYMFLGDWLKSEYGVRDATTESMAYGLNSAEGEGCRRGMCEDHALAGSPSSGRALSGVDNALSCTHVTCPCA